MRTPLNGRLSLDEHRRMIEKIGAATMIYGAGQAERAAALKAALPDLRVDRPWRRAVGPDLLALATARRTPIRACPPARRRHPRPVHLGHDRHAQGRAAHPCQLRAIVRNVLANLIDPKPGETMLHAASMIHASGCFVLPYWLRGGTRGDPARLRARFLSRGDRALAPRRAQPRADHAADAVPDARHRRRRSLLGRDHRLRRLADAAAGARARARPLGPGLRPILRPDRSAARHLRPRQGRACRRLRPSGCSPAAGRASIARSGWSTRTGDDAAGEPARSCCARRSR